MLSVNNISKSFSKNKVLSNVSFSLDKGKILGILGPNGAGKTTLLKTLARLNDPDTGEILIDGIPIKESKEIIGYVPQEIALFDELTVYDNLLCWSKLPKKKAKQKAEQLIEDFNLEKLYKKSVRTLSGGMIRRTNIAVALLNDPSILIMDEALVGIDIEQREYIIMMLNRLANNGITQVISSHYAGEILPLVEKFMILKNGSVKTIVHSEELTKKNNIDNDILTILNN